MASAGVPLETHFPQPYVVLLDRGRHAVGRWGVESVRDLVLAAKGLDASLDDIASLR